MLFPSVWFSYLEVRYSILCKTQKCSPNIHQFLHISQNAAVRQGHLTGSDQCPSGCKNRRTCLRPVSSLFLCYRPHTPVCAATRWWDLLVSMSDYEIESELDYSFPWLKILSHLFPKLFIANPNLSEVVYPIVYSAILLGFLIGATNLTQSKRSSWFPTWSIFKVLHFSK